MGTSLIISIGGIAIASAASEMVLDRMGQKSTVMALGAATEIGLLGTCIYFAFKLFSSASGIFL